VATSASFTSPSGLALSPNASILWVVDAGGHRVRAVALAPGGGAAAGVSTAAGAGAAGRADSRAPAVAQFSSPRGIAVHPESGVLYLSDSDNHLLRVLLLGGAAEGVSTLAGSGFAGFSEGVWEAAMFSAPHGVALLGAAGPLAVADATNNCFFINPHFPHFLHSAAISSIVMSPW
jgi:DNA-binding beta-propeller fold protein YncE